MGKKQTTGDRVYQVAICDQHTARAGKWERSFDFDDDSENRDDYLLFEGTREELLDTARGYWGNSKFHDRVAESLCFAIDADFGDMVKSHRERGKVPSKKELADQFVRCTDKIVELQKSGFHIPKYTFAEHVVEKFRLSFGAFFFWGPKTLAQLDLTYVDLVGMGIVQGLANDLGQSAAEVLHLSRLVNAELSEPFVKFENAHQ